MTPTPRHARPTKSSSKLVPKVILAVCILGLAICGIVFALQQFQLSKASQRAADTDIPVVNDTMAELVDNPIDFEALQKENPDIYAWVYIPNTGVNYPILQHPDNDFYYLNYNQDGVRSVEGAIYTELKNSKDFADPVTVVYGHNIKGGLMFATLHDFEDAAFFDENPEFQIFTPGHILTYRIVSATGADDAHILNTHDFSKEDELLAYFEALQNPSTEQANVREGIPLDGSSKIVQLSTCNYTFGNERYLLTGVLVNDQPSK